MKCFRIFVPVVAILLAGLVMAGGVVVDTPPAVVSAQGGCLDCHGNPELDYVFPSGETWSLFVDPDGFQNSIHGKEGLTCTGCHPAIENYPHPPLQAASVRMYQVTQYRTCARCHDQEYAATLDSIHAQEISAGDFNAAICTDCHGSHYATPPTRAEAPKSCSTCHSLIYEEYRNSVHGAALADERNTDVPTCTDCHGVHTQEDPRTASFRINSPQLCAKCHADEEMMGKYGISTNVFNTYLADFHGTTVTLFERQSPDVPTNKPVCYDCHGVHDMQKVGGGPDSLSVQENILAACRKCHPTATTNFPASWLGHYEPDPEKYPLVYFVDLFYKILIPTVLGGMGLYVAVDAAGTVARRKRGKKRNGEREVTDL